jgi:thiol:disulfide interchange protein DsbC
VAFTDESGRYFIFGHLFDMKERVDLTAQRKVEIKKTEFPSQFLNNAIKSVKGDGSRVVAIFSDPDCPYCQKLEGELARLDNVTIYTFLYPIAQLHPEAKTKAIAIWCSPNQQQAWTQTVLTGSAPKLVACNNPVNDNLVLGSRLGVVGTPTLIALDGRVLPGAAPAEKLDQWLNTPQPSAKTAQAPAAASPTLGGKPAEAQQ